MFESVDQKAVIVQIEFAKGRDDFSPLNAFDEFKELVVSSGAEIAREDFSKQAKPTAGLFITKGKAERIKDFVFCSTKELVDLAHKLVDRKITKDDKNSIKKILSEWLKNKEIDVIITTGGTGLTGRDITPEALGEIADKHIPGFGEVFRTVSLKTVGTSSIQSRACAGISKGKYLFSLPGSPSACEDAWEKIIKQIKTGE